MAPPINEACLNIVYQYACGGFDLEVLRPFFDEWPPKARDSWPELQDDTSFSATKLSISIPMTGSDFSTTTTTSPSPNATGIYSR